MNDGPQVDAPTEEIPGAWAGMVAAARASRRDAAALEEWTGNQLRSGGLSPVERGLLKGIRTLAVEQTAIAAAILSWRPSTLVAAEVQAAEAQQAAMVARAEVATLAARVALLLAALAAVVALSCGLLSLAALAAVVSWR